jgi:hypothetical protein
LLVQISFHDYPAHVCEKSPALTPEVQNAEVLGIERRVKDGQTARMPRFSVSNGV